jgi:hypothetical protein
VVLQSYYFRRAARCRRINIRRIRGIAAFFRGLMNWSFIMAGSASTNGLLFAIATWFVLAPMMKEV